MRGGGRSGTVEPLRRDEGSYGPPTRRITREERDALRLTRRCARARKRSGGKAYRGRRQRGRARRARQPRAGERSETPRGGGGAKTTTISSRAARSSGCGIAGARARAAAPSSCRRPRAGTARGRRSSCDLRCVRGRGRRARVRARRAVGDPARPPRGSGVVSFPGKYLGKIVRFFGLSRFPRARERRSTDGSRTLKNARRRRNRPEPKSFRTPHPGEAPREAPSVHSTRAPFLDTLWFFFASCAAESSPLTPRAGRRGAPPP